MNIRHPAFFRLLATTCLFALSAFPARAQENLARIEIAASPATPINLEIVSTSDGGRADWSGDNWQKVTAHFPAGPDWRSATLTFKPQNSGRLSLNLSGPWVRLDAPTRLLKVVRIDYDDVRVSGALLLNGGFEETFSTGEIRNWFTSHTANSNPAVSDANRAALVHGNAAEGVKFVRVWHNSRFGQSIDVMAGTPVTVTFSYRLAK